MMYIFGFIQTNLPMMCFVFCFLQRKEIFQYPALETIVHTVSNEREKQERRREKE